MKDGVKPVGFFKQLYALADAVEDNLFEVEQIPNIDTGELLDVAVFYSAEHVEEDEKAMGVLSVLYPFWSEQFSSSSLQLSEGAPFVMGSQPWNGASRFYISMPENLEALSMQASALKEYIEAVKDYFIEGHPEGLWQGKQKPNIFIGPMADDDDIQIFAQFLNGLCSYKGLPEGTVAEFLNDDALIECQDGSYFVLDRKKYLSLFVDEDGFTPEADATADVEAGTGFDLGGWNPDGPVS